MTTSRRVRAALVAAAIVSPFLAAGPAFAGNQMPVQAGGVWQCSDAGVSEINWTIYNQLLVPVSVTSAQMSGAFTGPVTFTGNVPPEDLLGSATVVLPPGTTGTVTLTAIVETVESEPANYTATATVDALLVCNGAETTTTTTTTSTSTTSTSTTVATSTTTAAPSAAAAAVVADPVFTG